MADKSNITTKAEVHAHYQAHRIKPDAEVSEADDSSCGDLSPGRDVIDPSQKNCRPVPAARGQGGHTVSRPPSSHLTPVDEEEPASSASPGVSATEGRKPIRPKSVETVDRGVGPTPAPQPPPSGSAGSLGETRLPSYLSFQPFGAALASSDPRTNGLLDAYAAAGNLPYPYGPYGCPVNTPLPLNPSTLEGRYHWPPVSFPPTLHGLSASPTPSDVSLLSMRSSMLPREPVSQLASRIHLEQLQRNYYSPLSSRRISSSGIPFPGANPFLGEYPTAPSLSGRSLFSDVPPTPGSGSITLPGSLESSRLNSPRASVVGGKSRKRTLSHSPISDYLDIQSLTRSSEGSLQLASFLQPNSRSSSAASGSYGHLSAASVGTASPAHPLLPTNPYYRQNPMAPPNFLYAPHFHPMLGRQPPGHPPTLPGQMLPPGMQGSFPMPGHKGVEAQMASSREQHISTTSKEAGSSSIVSSTMDGGTEGRKAKVKKEQENIHRSIHPDEEEEMYSERGEHIPQEGEPDFLETNCHWADCHLEFESQDELVKHINQDHIQSNKKSFVCRWAECSREEKPFKAQYMLVVHMRRHTGEKPHRCTFEGCHKAYSRLENLKTHLRSHTGEKPYMCEFPGCTKAFSNASDRAKHQNRTHSNAKPYVCKALGCTKRYTDPSSLRKHVKTVHGPDFYANKKHKGDSMCHVKKEDPDGDHDSCDVGTHQMDDKMGISSYSGPPSGDNRNSQDNIGSAPSSNSQLSPESSPEVIVTCGLDQGQGQLIDDQVNSGSGGGRGRGGSFGMEEDDVIVPEPNEADCGTGTLLTRRNAINTGHLIQNRLKDKMHTKGGLLSPLPHLPSIHSPVSHPPAGESGIGGESCQVSITDLAQKKGGRSQGSPQHKRITDLAGKEPNNWRDNGTTLLPASRRESNTSSLSSYMSSMRSDTFSSRRSSGFSQFSSRRSSGASRLSIANSPYEYDITGNLPNSVSRRSSEESSTNIGNVSAMMQKANLGSRPSAGSIGSTGGLAVANPPSTMLAGGSGGSSTNVMQCGGGISNASMASCAVGAGAAAASGGGCGSGCAAAVAANGGAGAGGVSGGGCGGNGSGNRYYNDRLARYFNNRKGSDGMRSETPCMTPLPHEIPNREIRRASDPVKSKTDTCSNDDPLMGKSLQRCRSLNMVKPLPTPASMKSLKHQSGSVNTFKSSHSSIATDVSLPELSNKELEEKMLEDTEDVIIPDDMRRFLDESAKHHHPHHHHHHHHHPGNHGDGERFNPAFVEDGADGILESLENPQDSNRYNDNRFAGAGSPGLSPTVNNNNDNNNNNNNTNNNDCNNFAVMNANMNTSPHHHSHHRPLQVGNLQVQTGFADLRGGGSGVVAGMSPSQPMDALQQPSPHQRHNFSGNNNNSNSGNNGTTERKGSYHSLGGGSDVSPCVKIENCGSDQQNANSNMSCCRLAGSPNNNNANMASPTSNQFIGKPANVNRQCQGHGNNDQTGRAPMSGHHVTGCGPSANVQHPSCQPPHPPPNSYHNFNNNKNMAPPPPCGGSDLRPHQHPFPPSPSPSMTQHPHPHPQWGTSAGNGPVSAAYLSQHNLMQHQIQQQYQQHHQQQRHLQQHQQNMAMPPPPPQHHPNLSVERPMSQSSSNMQAHPPSTYPNPYINTNGIPPPLPPGGFSPMPPTGEKPISSRPHHHKQCASPQVQVPHISQSQIPPNAKAANRNTNMAMKHQTSQPSLQINNNSNNNNNTQQPLPSPLPHPPTLMSPNNNNNPQPCHIPHPPHHMHHPQPQYPQYGPYPPPHNHPLHPSSQLPPPQSPHLFNQNISPYNNAANNNPQQPYLNPHLQPPIHNQHHPSCHQPQSSPSSYNQQPQQSFHPMEMSPGCNQVTSSTDCKETTGPAIEDFMDNLTSISAENLMESITSISQENIVYSPTPASMRTASQNSGRYNSLMNTSNMVVNDMSSVLTQLAEENKYLSMRP